MSYSAMTGVAARSIHLPDFPVLHLSVPIQTYDKNNGVHHLITLPRGQRLVALPCDFAIVLFAWMGVLVRRKCKSRWNDMRLEQQLMLARR